MLENCRNYIFSIQVTKLYFLLKWNEARISEFTKYAMVLIWGNFFLLVFFSQTYFLYIYSPSCIHSLSYECKRQAFGTYVFVYLVFDYKCHACFIKHYQLLLSILVEDTLLCKRNCLSHNFQLNINYPLWKILTWSILCWQAG